MLLCFSNSHPQHKSRGRQPSLHAQAEPGRGEDSRVWDRRDIMVCLGKVTQPGPARSPPAAPGARQC